jgi:hypothetical protein
VIHEWGEFEPDLSDDLGPPVQRFICVFPLGQRQFRPWTCNHLLPPFCKTFILDNKMILLPSFFSFIPSSNIDAQTVLLLLPHLLLKQLVLQIQDERRLLQKPLVCLFQGEKAHDQLSILVVENFD